MHSLLFSKQRTFLIEKKNGNGGVGGLDVPTNTKRL